MRTALLSSTTALTLMLGSLSVASAAAAVEQMDQSNLPEWAGGWTHVSPAGEGQAAMWQTFTPARANLTAVGIDVLTISPGRGDDLLTVEIAQDGAVLTAAERSVQDGWDGLLRFEFPAAVPLVPGQVYELKVRDTGMTLFGWRYGPNTYERGSRYVFAQPRTGTDWFFRTYAEVEPAVVKYSGGTGEPNDPYHIATAADLIALGETPGGYDKHFLLTADIDLDPNLPGRTVFDRAVIAPDGNDINVGWLFDGTPFTGVFDGNGHTISRLTIDGAGHLGLFGQLAPGSLISNLRLATVDVNGIRECVGGLVGENHYGSIVKSQSTGAVRGDSRVGGLAGQNWGDVSRCYSVGAVSGTGWGVGGLVGFNAMGGGVTQCYSAMTVSGNEDVGGLVGLNYATAGRCYSSGVVRGSERVGGLVGSDRQRPGRGATPQFGVVIAGFWDTQTSGQATSAGGAGKITAEMQTAETFLDAGWDFVGEAANGTEDIWWILEGQDYPRLR
ncbi:MAG: hypothetical protein MUC88_00690 [Planctomycetes bacterium]|nr:hypothetical protein [Planctomycetota bacterium]